MMLDMRRTFDEMVEAHAEPDRAEKILANPFYQTISTSFSGTQEYMAMEKLGQLAATGEVGPDRGRHPAVALRAGLPRRPAADVDVPRRPHDPAAVRARPGRRAGRCARSSAPGSRSSPRRCRRSSAGRCWPTRRRSCRRSTRCSAASGSAPPPPTSCCARRAPRSSWSPRPSRTRCARRRTSSTGSRTEEMPLAGLVLNRTHPVLRRPLGEPGARRGRRAARRAAGGGRAAAARRPRRPRRPRGAAARPLHRRAPRGAGHPGARRAADVDDLDGLREIGGHLAAAPARTRTAS